MTEGRFGFLLIRLTCMYGADDSAKRSIVAENPLHAIHCG